MGIPGRDALLYLGEAAEALAVQVTPSRAARLRRLAKDYERLPETVAGLRFVAFACHRLNRAVLAPGPGP